MQDLRKNLQVEARGNLNQPATKPKQGVNNFIFLSDTNTETTKIRKEELGQRNVMLFAVI